MDLFDGVIVLAKMQIISKSFGNSGNTLRESVVCVVSRILCAKHALRGSVCQIWDIKTSVMRKSIKCFHWLHCCLNFSNICQYFASLWVNARYIHRFFEQTMSETKDQNVVIDDKSGGDVKDQLDDDLPIKWGFDDWTQLYKIAIKFFRGNHRFNWFANKITCLFCRKWEQSLSSVLWHSKPIHGIYITRKIRKLWSNQSQTLRTSRYHRQRSQVSIDVIFLFVCN